MTRIGVILLLTFVARWGIKIAFGHLEKRFDTGLKGASRQARLLTLLRLGRSLSYAVILVLAGLMILQTLEINITPILASVGVVGLALSLGTQTLVKDYIGGLLILIENQFDVGDVIEVGQFKGAVERITLRATSLRGLEGELHIIPNGEIRALSNLTEDWARVVIPFNLEYEADLHQVLEVLRGAAAEAESSPEIRENLLEAPEVVGWVGLTDWAVQARLMAKVKPGEQWDVANELRRLALDALHTAGIQIAVPRQMVQVSSHHSRDA